MPTAMNHGCSLHACIHVTAVYRCHRISLLGSLVPTTTHGFIAAKTALRTTRKPKYTATSEQHRPASAQRGATFSANTDEHVMAQIGPSDPLHRRCSGHRCLGHSDSTAVMNHSAEAPSRNPS